PVSQFATQEAAVAAAESALTALFTAPAIEDDGMPESAEPVHSAPPVDDSGAMPARRAFFRKVAGQT
ncbi:MAG: [NiFe]-hydrogenase assembly chaperone HybE, partial [Candidatus Accumulibacter sp.]|uniref:[NiFe]-hydrogenase assembly chaperone HybE n=1 Tax=Accumulibacter sp. TaxID=2053492 RepID=UPI002878EB00